MLLSQSLHDDFGDTHCTHLHHARGLLQAE
nr:MAG TPA: hypothetical protein [Caudoviricetes sp.]